MMNVHVYFSQVICKNLDLRFMQAKCSLLKQKGGFLTPIPGGRKLYLGRVMVSAKTISPPMGVPTNSLCRSALPFLPDPMGSNWHVNPCRLT